MDDNVKQAMRHRYEACTSFNAIVRIARAREQEAIEAKDFRGSQARPRVQHNPVNTEVSASDIPAGITKEASELKELRRKVERLELECQGHARDRSQAL